MNVVNVNDLIRKVAAKYKMRVSPDAVNEYAGRIADHIEDNTHQLVELAKRDGRLTIMEEDVITHFGFVKNTIAGKIQEDD